MISVKLFSIQCSVVQQFKRGMKRRAPNPGKPPIIPPRKTRLYSIPTVVKWSEPEDVKDMLWRRHVYNNAFISLQKVFKEEAEKNESNFGMKELIRQQQEELERLIDENNKRNMACAIEREKREKEKNEQLRLKILEDIEKTLEKEDKDIKIREIEVQEAIRISANFVTSANLTEKILEALENPTVFDFAIDLEGKKFYLGEPEKYVEGLPKIQKRRSFDISHSQNMIIDKEKQLSK